MLKIACIGFGNRMYHVVKGLMPYGIPFRVVAICDPRAEEIKQRDDGWLEGCEYFDDADDMLDKVDADGVAIGTRCHLHTRMALKVARRGLPLYIEKPVAIEFDQVKALDEAFRDYPAPVVVSFPLRVTPICAQVKRMIEADEIGTVQRVVGFNDVPAYGKCYYHSWYRNYHEMGGLFLQKATHDLDTIYYLLGQRPRRLCAMKGQQIYGEAGTIYGGDKPFELLCRDCGEQADCPESPFNLYYQRFERDAVVQDDKRHCLFARDIKNEDFGHCLIEYERGAQTAYTQTFFVRNKAARRGARLYGYKGTIDFDWYRNDIRLYRHDLPAVQTMEFSGDMSHFGGDRELAYDFLMAMKERRPTRATMADGILSALTCLCARRSAENLEFVDVAIPE